MILKKGHLGQKMKVGRLESKRVRIWLSVRQLVFVKRKTLRSKYICKGWTHKETSKEDFWLSSKASWTHTLLGLNFD